MHAYFAYNFSGVCVCVCVCGSLLQFTSTSVFAWLICTTQDAFVIERDRQITTDGGIDKISIIFF